MSSGEGLVGLLYAFKNIFEAGIIWVLTGGAVLAFFWLIIKFMGNKIGWFESKGGVFGGSGKVTPGQIMWGLIILTVIFSLYSLIGLTGSIFGVNSAPVGGIYRNN